MPILPCFRLLPKYASPSLQRKRHKTCAAFCLHFLKIQCLPFQQRIRNDTRLLF
ncbi:hypothetical protein UUU_28520 [Klebsiella pneumoniae subsp. pneumoniae DSM 30104 = JCM 1662 = NBRC 14940]|nr:hypothetical protein UUU_28520 [Klebsiella pneumoniae subsp. pneumoniae DSM 30104 = JCM 1662 = NBRC 14940]